MTLHTRWTVHGAEHRLHLTGLLDYSTIDQFDVQLPACIDALVIDFSGLHFIDSTGIGAILSLIYAAHERGFPITLEGLDETARLVFETVGVFGVMEFLREGGR